MGLEFLRNYGAKRMRDDMLGPVLLDNEDGSSGDKEQKRLDYEVPAEEWEPIDISAISIPARWEHCPGRFIDGKDLGRTVAWLQTDEWFPIPVRLSEIGAVVMHNAEGKLRREWYSVERVVSMIIDPFPWHEIESFAVALQEEGFRLLACQKPQALVSLAERSSCILRYPPLPVSYLSYAPLDVLGENASKQICLFPMGSW